ncbi:MAG: hypothetical protein JO000_12380 [Alphaproteobacteria bacterium]|nr:hypothetical protein [Alphaproteobacteria bacterium]
MMLARSFTVLTLSLALTPIAFAQPGTAPGTTSSPSGTAQQGSTQTQHESLPQELRQKLSDAGYTDIQIVPQSFVVSAKTKDGNPVLMRISPNEMTVLTEAPADGTTAGNAPATTGSTGENTTTGSNSTAGSNGANGQTTGDRFSHPAGLPQGSGSQK